MQHVCSQECRLAVDAAALGLEEATRSLRISLLSNSDELIWSSYARVRAAKARLRGAMEDYQEHLLDGDYQRLPSDPRTFNRGRAFRAFTV